MVGIAVLTILLILLLLHTFFAISCRGLAKEQKRNKNLATILGFIFGLLAILVYLFLRRDDDIKLNK